MPEIIKITCCNNCHFYSYDSDYDYEDICIRNEPNLILLDAFNLHKIDERCPLKGKELIFKWERQI